MTTASRLHVHRAATTDMPIVLGLLDEAAAWLQSRDIEQWPEQFSGPVDDWRLERLRAYVAAGDTYLLKADDEPIATITWTLKADPDYAAGWPDGPDTGGYVHRMAVRRTHAGQGLGPLLLDWAGAQTAAAGRPWLRLDCSRTNRPLQVYYEQQGFVRVGDLVAEIDPAGTAHSSGTSYQRKSGALYQRPSKRSNQP